MTVTRHDPGDPSHPGELRSSPRVDTRLQAALFAEHGKVTGVVANISRTGLCFEGDKTLADLLLASVRPANGIAPLNVKVCLEVPAGTRGTVPVVAQARTIYVIHDHADVYLCGLEFRIFSEGGEAFEAYLREQGVVG